MKNKKEISRQANMKQRRRDQGLCVDCGDVSETYRCTDCQVKHSAANRERVGSQPWRKGGPGRPPFVI